MANALSTNQSCQRVPGSGLSRPEPADVYEYGQKMGQIVSLIRDIPIHDRVIVFVQFQKAHGEVKKILENNGITVMDLINGDVSEKLMAFQKNEMYGTKAAKNKAAKTSSSLEGAKILLLNISDASAAGR
jgi:hypothetical protein